MPMKVYTSQAMQRLRDAFDLKGKHDLQLDEIIVPVAIVADLAPTEQQINQQASWYFSVPASVAANGKAVLFNGVTTDSGRDIVIDYIVYSAAATQVWEFRQTTDAPLNPIGSSDLDKQYRQLPGLGTPPGIQFADDGAITGDLFHRGLRAGNTTAVLDVGVRLGFQQGVSLQVVANNQSFFCTFFGRVVSRL